MQNFLVIKATMFTEQQKSVKYGRKANKPQPTVEKTHFLSTRVFLHPKWLQPKVDVTLSLIS